MKFSKVIFFCIYLCMFSFAFGQDFFAETKKLVSANYQEKETILKEMANAFGSDEKFLQLLEHLEAGKLYYIKETKETVFLDKKGDKKYTVTQFLNTAKQIELSKKELSKITINNRVRGVIKSLENDINIVSPNKSKRLKATKSLLARVDENDKELIAKVLTKEKDSDIKNILLEAEANLQAKYSEGTEQIEAIKKLGGFLSNKSVQTLNELKTKGKTNEIKKRATKSLQQIEASRKAYSYIETAFFGLSLGSVLLLAAIGLAITFGVMKVINMAHGELIMIGAYTTYVIQAVLPNFTEYSIILAIPSAFLVGGIFGILIEKLIIRHLYGRPLETLLATFGISLFLQQLVRSIFSTLNQEVKTPSWMSGAIEINDVLSLTYNRIYIVLFSLFVFAAVLLVMKKTSLGLKIRAVSQNRQTAIAMGVNSNLIDALTFGLGSGIAGVAGVALSQLTNVGPNLGQAYIVDSFMVVVFGGVGNLWGTLIAAFSLGEINKFIEPFFGAVLAKVLILVFIILFIQKRPRGLFPQAGRDSGE